mmetsp:Transcript_13597/g.28720  ORF Transcript_13597/g.28720 Transcript_13597/m.28720 type:complete len:120 (-) Transcript_13597:50-409(-)
MHLLKNCVLQANRMLMEYGEQIKSTYFNIPQSVKNIMGDTSKYNVDFDSNISPHSEKVPHSNLLMKGSTEKVEVEELPRQESSVEGREDSDEEIEGDDKDEGAKGIVNSIMEVSDKCTK